ncbi:hypothetical protein C8J55DRAFT_504439 [Lentinula edodes]|uniref:Uncharacterized protein n=1 Tax=Lentinula lateritia TaxID=40482 RepID=A0A9W9AVP8_9AGAR|nr:hypothetical protein C8J55DRAFT_504439 [Lentinula edodes]
MHLNPTYLFLGLVSAALSISSTCAVPLNASPEDSLATRAPVQNTVPVNSAGPVGSLAMRTSTRDTEPVEAAISLAIRETHEVDIVFKFPAPPQRGGYVRNSKEVRTKVHKVVEGYWARMRLSGTVLTTLKNCPKHDYVDDFYVSGSVQGYFHTLTPTTWTDGDIVWEVE